MEPVLVDTPSHFPGACLDGRQDGPVVTAGQTLQGYGVLYFSRQMLRDYTRLVRPVVEELAGEIGWVSQVDHADALQARDVRIVDLEGRLAELEPVERALMDAATRYAEVDG